MKVKVIKKYIIEHQDIIELIESHFKELGISIKKPIISVKEKFDDFYGDSNGFDISVEVEVDSEEHKKYGS